MSLLHGPGKMTSQKRPAHRNESLHTFALQTRLADTLDALDALQVKQIKDRRRLRRYAAALQRVEVERNEMQDIIELLMEEVRFYGGSTAWFQRKLDRIKTGSVVQVSDNDASNTGISSNSSPYRSALYTKNKSHRNEYRGGLSETPTSRKDGYPDSRREYHSTSLPFQGCLQCAVFKQRLTTNGDNMDVAHHSEGSAFDVEDALNSIESKMKAVQDEICSLRTKIPSYRRWNLDEYQRSPWSSHRTNPRHTSENHPSSSNIDSCSASTNSTDDASQSGSDTKSNSPLPSQLSSPSPNYIEMRPLVFQSIINEIDKFEHAVNLFSQQHQLMVSQIRNAPEDIWPSERLPCPNSYRMNNIIHTANHDFDQDDPSSFLPQFCSSVPNSDRRPTKKKLIDTLLHDNSVSSSQARTSQTRLDEIVDPDDPVSSDHNGHPYPPDQEILEWEIRSGDEGDLDAFSAFISE